MSPRPKPKAPRTPPDQLSREPHDIADYTGALWRVHRTEGEHVLPWNRLRTYAPLPSMRWDPHPGSQPISAVEGVLYAAADVATSLAEVYQTTRVIDTRAGAATLTAWRPQRSLRLLDLSGTWLLRNTASAALLAAPDPSANGPPPLDAPSTSVGALPLAAAHSDAPCCSRTK